MMMTTGMTMRRRIMITMMTITSIIIIINININIIIILIMMTRESNLLLDQPCWLLVINIVTLDQLHR